MLLPRLKNDGIPELTLNTLQREMKQQVEDKIKRNIYEFEEAYCIICSSSDSELIGEKDRYGFYYPTRICKSCGLIFTAPRMTQNSYNKFYNDEYRKLYNGTSVPSQQFFLNQYHKGSKIYDSITSHDLLNDGTSKFVLEVGCGAGGILQYFKQKGHTVKGIDLGDEYINFGRQEHGLDLTTGMLDTIQLDKLPDLIIYSHVLEHLLDIEKELKLIKNISNENTLIYIEVPGVKQIDKNYKMNILTYFQNAHTYHFTLTSLINLFNKHGFVPIYGDEYVRAVFKLGVSNSKEVNDFTPAVSYIKRLENLRHFYKFTPAYIKKTKLKRGVSKILNLLRGKKN